MFLSVVTFYFGVLSVIGFFQNKAKLGVLNSGWPFNRGKDNGKPSSGRPKGGCGRFIEVAG